LRLVITVLYRFSFVVERSEFQFQSIFFRGFILIQRFFCESGDASRSRSSAHNRAFSTFGEGGFANNEGRPGTASKDRRVAKQHRRAEAPWQATEGRFRAQACE
jgi:hypothetical protein